MFKTRLARLALVCTAFFAATGFIVVGDDIGLPAKGGTPETLEADRPSKLEAAQTTLEAHEMLVDINPDNLSKFKSVLEYLQDDIRNLSND